MRRITDSIEKEIRHRASLRRSYRKNREKILARTASWRLANPDRVRAYRDTYQSPENRRLKRYGLTAEAYAEMLVRQDGACAICLTRFVETPNVDHDGETGIVRGLLCGPHNRAIGLMAHSPAVLRSAARYLEKELN